MTAPYQRIHIVVNPASGRDEPILNTINDVFHPHGIEWDVSVTLKYGDARRFARAAAERGVDLVVGYGGDGTQHELANALIGTGVIWASCPEATATASPPRWACRRRCARRPSAVHQRQREARRRRARGDEIFIQRLYTGSTRSSRPAASEGQVRLLGYAIALPKQLRTSQRTKYRLTLDGEVIEREGFKCYIVNSGGWARG